MQAVSRPGGTSEDIPLAAVFFSFLGGDKGGGRRRTGAAGLLAPASGSSAAAPGRSWTTGCPEWILKADWYPTKKTKKKTWWLNVVVFFQPV
jgi:hypothetical protein